MKTLEDPMNTRLDVVLGKYQSLKIKGIGKRIRLTNDITNISNAYGSQLAQLDFILQHRNH